MGVEELDRSSCSGAKRLEVVVGLVGLVVLGVLVVLAYLAYLDLPCFREYLVALAARVHLGFLVDHSFLVALVDQVLVVDMGVVGVLLQVPLESQRSMAKLSFGCHRRRHHNRRRHLHNRRRNHTENVYWIYHACRCTTSVSPKVLICSTKFSDRTLVVGMVVVVVELEY